MKHEEKTKMGVFAHSMFILIYLVGGIGIALLLTNFIEAVI